MKNNIGIVPDLFALSQAYGVYPLGVLYLSGKIGINHHKNCPINLRVYKIFFKIKGIFFLLILKQEENHRLFYMYK